MRYRPPCSVVLLSFVVFATIGIGLFVTGTIGAQATQTTTPTETDTDGDDLTDEQERSVYGTDPNRVDTDGDGLSDGAEVREYTTNPTVADTDDDGVPDGEEVRAGFDPTQPNDHETPPPRTQPDRSLFERLFPGPGTALLVVFALGVLVGGGLVALVRR